MSVERIVYCDAPECKGHARTTARRPSGMLFVTGTGGLAAQSTLHFCSWDCLLQFGSGQPPVEHRDWENPPWSS